MGCCSSSNNKISIEPLKSSNEKIKADILSNKYTDEEVINIGQGAAPNRVSELLYAQYNKHLIPPRKRQVLLFLFI